MVFSGQKRESKGIGVRCLIGREDQLLSTNSFKLGIVYGFLSLIVV